MMDTTSQMSAFHLPWAARHSQATPHSQAAPHSGATPHSQATPHSGATSARQRLTAMDRRQRLSIRSACWWRGHRWDYRMSTQRVIIEFRQCLRCGEVEIQVC
jgi:hypothetical protein